MFTWLKVWWHSMRLYSNDALVQTAAAEALLKLGGPQVVEPLIRALGRANDHGRQTAAETLGKLADSRATVPLTTTAKCDGDPRVRRAAVEALAELPLAVIYLPEAMEDPDSGVRRAAVEAMERSGNLDAIELLITATGDPDSGVRYAAVNAVGNLGGPRAVDTLIKAIADRDHVVRTIAVEFLGESRTTGS